MYIEQNKSLGTASRNQVTDSPEILRDAGPIGKAIETTGYLNELEQLHGAIRRKLYGPFPQEAQSIEKRAEAPSLEELLRVISERTAWIVGDAKNLLSRLD